MILYQCDNCEKSIKDRDEMISIYKGNYAASIFLCEQCAKPVSSFLKKKKLLKDRKNEKAGKR
ncbi:MAG: hypothetical protein A2928_02990 [Candidatus Taylorbacteria bacterium RIFCSPLOWO2_01_FULL_45_15b]|uniref:Uncharacterized protein n=1 Tax=Candidatus Taylorbacteria bacterium RIFCSPLOWO2_01_FULL_45_15b TaxID=1802319 RepID=A0A1G2NCE8_9BACT|nr:MAG: hypothetical protein A2928_02990 [Candidatus Taylorbacteria bacterium RIFCSPLOWO2_01_FULL_45_15b]